MRGAYQDDDGLLAPSPERPCDAPATSSQLARLRRAGKGANHWPMTPAHSPKKQNLFCSVSNATEQRTAILNHVFQRLAYQAPYSKFRAPTIKN
jgi:hypothetical protein